MDEGRKLLFYLWHVKVYALNYVTLDYVTVDLV